MTPAPSWMVRAGLLVQGAVAVADQAPTQQMIPQPHTLLRRFRRVIGQAGWPVLVAAATAAGGPGQERAASNTTPAGNSTLVVRVVDANTGAPVKNARVVANLASASTGASPPRDVARPPRTVSTTVDGIAYSNSAAPKPRLQKGARTDRTGTAVMTALPEGTYSLAVLPTAGFVSGETTMPVRVPDRGNATALVKLTRGGSVSGRIFDEDGEPAVSASVRVVRLDAGGSVRPVASGVAPGTDDRGHFRVWGLPAGEYFVSATQGYQPFPGEDTPPAEHHVPTFYPGVAAFDAAKTVTVKAGQETGSIDFALASGALATVSGRVTDASGNPVEYGGDVGGNVEIFARRPGPDSSNRSALIRSDGSYSVSGIPPGEYYVSAVLFRRGPARGSREGGFVTASVNGGETTVNIQLNEGATLSGRIVVEGATVVPPEASQAWAPTVSLANGLGVSRFPVFTAPPPVAVRPDGTFEFTGIRGHIQISAQGEGAALKEVTRDGHDISGQPLELAGTERIDDVLVVMTRETGGVDVKVHDAVGEPVGGATVLIFQDDPKRWWTGSPFVHQVRAAPSGGSTVDEAARAPRGGVAASPAGGEDVAGTLSVTMLPAGRYALVAFPPGTYLAPDRDALTRWRAAAKIVTVDVGRTTTAELTPIK
jgi:hypothetical protein